MWILESFGSACAESAYNASSHQIGRRWSYEAIVWWQRVIACLIIVATARLMHGSFPAWPPARFWAPAAVSIVMNVVASLLYVRALRDDLSLTVPITALSPVFMLVTEPLLTGRFVPAIGMLGVAVIAAGLYLLNLQVLGEQGPLGPFRNLWRQRGPRLMLITVIIWAVTAPMDAVAIRSWDPLWYAAALHGGIGLITTPLCWRKPQALEPRPYDRARLGAIAAVSSVATMLQMTAMAVAPATYVIAIRRFAAPLTAAWGAIFFHERHVRTRLLGALVMAIGAAILLLSR